MKKVIFLAVLSVCFYSYKLPDLQRPSSVKDQTIIYSSPRSGTNLTVCTVQILTKRPLAEFYPYQIAHVDPFRRNRILVDIDITLPYFFVTHSTDYLKKISKKKNKVVLVIRNPVELVMRYAKDDWNLVQSLLNSKEIDSKLYMDEFFDRLQLFDKWDPDHRLIVYYDQILLHPEEVLPELLEFLGEDMSLLNEHLENLEEDRAKMLKFYDNVHKLNDGSMSKGKGTLYHTKKMPNKLVNELKIYFKDKEPYLWEKYLQMYE